MSAVPEIVQAQPSPTSWTMTPGNLDATGKKVVAITLNTVCGVFTFFLTPDEAKMISAQLEKVATQASTHLVLP